MKAVVWHGYEGVRPKSLTRVFKSRRGSRSPRLRGGTVLWHDPEDGAAGFVERTVGRGRDS